VVPRGRVPRRVAVVTVVLLLAACGDPTPPSASPAGVAPTPSPTPTASPTPSPTPKPVPSLTVAIDGDLAGGYSDAARGIDAMRISELIHDGLFSLDARLRPVPRLATEAASVSADGLTWTVHVRDDVRFTDGSALTAADVVRTYALAASPRCPYRPALCLAGVLESVAAPDPRTVAFTLREPLAAFATTWLGLGIESAAAMDVAYAAFVAGLGDVTVTDTAGYLELVATELAHPTGPADADDHPTIDYPSLRADGAALLTRASVTVPDPAEQTVDGKPDRAADLEAIVARVRAIDATFTSRPIDALATAYPFLSTAADPVTSGPFRLERGVVSGGQDVPSIRLLRNDAHTLGVPALEYIDLVTVSGEGAAVAGLRDGSVDVRSGLSAAAAKALVDDPDIRLVTYPDFAVTGLTFNLHPEAKGLFLDRNLRQALALCFDHAAAVTAAVGDDGVLIDTEIPTMSWAYPATGLAAYPLDPARATALIEASGWTRGSDGIYEQGARRLSTVVPVRDDAPERVAWLRAVAASVRRCGIDLRVAEVPFAAILRMLAVYPHVNAADPDAKRPFDAYFGGLETGVDPDPYRLYHSSQCTSAEQPDTYNVGCYANVGVDRLLEAARVDPDLTTRAALYRQSAARISEDVPILYAWSDLVHDGMRATVGTTMPGGIPLDTPTWAAPAERLTNVR
jgi:ABC-type transport system substrate-binding protein